MQWFLIFFLALGCVSNETARKKGYVLEDKDKEKKKEKEPISLWWNSCPLNNTCDETAIHRIADLICKEKLHEETSTFTLHEARKADPKKVKLHTCDLKVDPISNRARCVWSDIVPGSAHHSVETFDILRCKKTTKQGESVFNELRFP